MYYRRRRRRLTVIENVLNTLESTPTPAAVATFVEEEGNREVQHDQRLIAPFVTPQDITKKRHRGELDHFEIHRQKRKKTHYEKYVPRKRIQFDPPQANMPYNRRKRIRTTARPSRFNSTLGNRPGKHASRKVTWFKDITTSGDKVPNSYRLIEIAHNTDESIINTRRGDYCNVKGVKLRTWFRLNNLLKADDPAFTYPLQVRWAVINPKNNNGGISVPTSDFFVKRSPTTTIYRDFPGTGTWYDFMTEKINREEYGVLKEGSFMMGKNAGQSQVLSSTYPRMTDPGNVKMIDIWIPIRKQMKFNSTASQVPDVNLYFVWWYCALADSTQSQIFPGGDPPNVQHPIQEMHEKKIYFTNAAVYS